MSMFSKLKQIPSMAEKQKRLKSLLDKEEAQGSSGWGKVKITLNGSQHVTAVSIDPSCLADGPALEKLVQEAANDATEKLQRHLAFKTDLAKEIQDLLKE